jgi:hypothetical protein
VLVEQLKNRPECRDLMAELNSQDEQEQNQGSGRSAAVSRAAAG